MFEEEEISFHHFALIEEERSTWNDTLEKDCVEEEKEEEKGERNWVLILWLQSVDRGKQIIKSWRVE